MNKISKNLILNKIWIVFNKIVKSFYGFYQVIFLFTRKLAAFSKIIFLDFSTFSTWILSSFNNPSHRALSKVKGGGGLNDFNVMHSYYLWFFSAIFFVRNLKTILKIGIKIVFLKNSKLKYIHLVFCSKNYKISGFFQDLHNHFTRFSKNSKFWAFRTRKLQPQFFPLQVHISHSQNDHCR